MDEPSIEMTRAISGAPSCPAAGPKPPIVRLLRDVDCSPPGGCAREAALPSAKGPTSY